MKMSRPNFMKRKTKGAFSAGKERPVPCGGQVLCGGQVRPSP